MATVILRTNTDDQRFIDLVKELDAELYAGFGGLMTFFAPQNVVKSEKAVVVIVGEKPVACGCFKKFDSETVEMKRVYVKPDFRRKGLAEVLMVELQELAREGGFARAVLETGRRLKGAIRLYEKLGYSVIENYPPYVGQAESVCYAKSLID